MMKRISILFLMVVSLTCCREKNTKSHIESNMIGNVKIARALYTKKKEEIKLTGTVIPKDGAKILSKVVGEVVAIRVKEGDKIKKGTLLIQINDKEYRARFNQAKYAVKEIKKHIVVAKKRLNGLKSQYLLAKKTYDRFSKLREKGVVSKQKFDEVVANYHSAKSSYQAAKAEVLALIEKQKVAIAKKLEAKTYLDYTRIKSPFEGRVIKKFVDIGESVSYGMPLIEIQRNNYYQIRCSVPEGYINFIKIGEEITSKILGKIVIGKVHSIVPLGDERARSYEVKIDIPTYNFIKPNMYAEVYIPTREKNFLLIPENSVVYHGQITGIFVVNNRGVIHFRIIRVGRTMGGMREVISGLRVGDRYVLTPPSHIKDGDRIKSWSQKDE